MEREHKSRMRIVQALGTMMETVPIDKIQVTKLCREANVGRATFYDNFENVYAVATWYWDQVLAETLYCIGKNLGFFDAHLAMFQRLFEERAFFRNAFRSNDYSSINLYGMREIGQFYLDTIERKQGRTLSEEDLAAIHFFNIGASDYCAEWVREGMKESPELMAKTFANATPPSMACLL